MCRPREVLQDFVPVRLKRNILCKVVHLTVQVGSLTRKKMKYTWAFTQLHDTSASDDTPYFF